MLSHHSDHDEDEDGGREGVHMPCQQPGQSNHDQQQQQQQQQQAPSAAPRGKQELEAPAGHGGLVGQTPPRDRHHACVHEKDEEDKQGESRGGERDEGDELEEDGGPGEEDCGGGDGEDSEPLKEGGEDGHEDDKEESDTSKSCDCVECLSPEPRPWACEYRCTCEQCEEARSPTAGAAAGFCSHFVNFCEAMAAPNRASTQADSCRARWQRELDDCVARRGDQGLASVTYALRLAHLLFKYDMTAEARALYERFLAPRLLDKRRRGELSGAASPGALVDFARKYGDTHAAAGDYASAKQTFLAALDISMRHVNGSSGRAGSNCVLWSLSVICMKLKEHENAWKYLQLKLRRESKLEELQREERRYCCHEENVSEPILQLYLEIAEGACEACQKANVLGVMLNSLGLLLSEADLCLERAESYFKRALAETEGSSGADREDSESLAIILNNLGTLYIRAWRYEDAAASLRRACIMREAAFGLAHEGMEHYLTKLFLTLIRMQVPDRSLIDFYLQKQIAFTKLTGKEPAEGLGALDHEAMARASLALSPAPAPALPRERKQGRLATKLEERRRKLEEERRAEAERQRARREAESAERAERDAADRKAAVQHMRESNWARARQLLNALLKRSPGDVDARLLRIQCMAGAGQLEAAAREAGAWERELAAAASSSDANIDLRAKLREERLKARAALEQQQREAEAEAQAALAEEEARRLAAAEEQRLEERPREEARRRELEEAARRAAEDDRRRAEEERRASASSQVLQRREEQQGRRKIGAAAAAAGDRQTRASGSAAPSPGGPTQEEGECAICLAPMRSATASLPCGHRFHGRCIATWRASPLGTSCPQCRAPFSPAGAAPVGNFQETPPVASTLLGPLNFEVLAPSIPSAPPVSIAPPPLEAYPYAPGPSASLLYPPPPPAYGHTYGPLPDPETPPGYPRAASSAPATPASAPLPPVASPAAPNPAPLAEPRGGPPRGFPSPPPLSPGLVPAPPLAGPAPYPCPPAAGPSAPLPYPPVLPRYAPAAREGRAPGILPASGHPPHAPPPAPAAASSSFAPRPTRPYLPPGGPPARPTRPYDPFNRGAGVVPSRASPPA
eukprot:tig00021098_g18178.t1